MLRDIDNQESAGSVADVVAEAQLALAAPRTFDDLGDVSDVLAEVELACATPPALAQVGDVVAEAGRVLAEQAVPRPAPERAPHAAAPATTRRRTPSPSVLKCCQLLVDLVTLAAAMAVAYALRAFVPGRDVSAAVGDHVLLGAISLPLWALVFFRYRLYSETHVSGRLEEFRRLGHAVVAGAALVACTGFALKAYVARGWLLLMVPTALIAVTLEREIVRRTVARLRRTGRLLRPVVVVGANGEAAALCSMLAEHVTLGYRVLGLIDDTSPVGYEVAPGVRVLGGTEEAVELARRVGATDALVATTALDHEASNRLVRRLVAAGVHVDMSFSLRDIASERLHVRALGPFPVLRLEPRRRHGWRLAAKRAFDLGAAGVLGLLALPLMLLIAMAVKVSSRGPVLFRQTRVGQDGEPFEILKFRTMVVNAEQLMADLGARNEADGPLFKMRRDPRCTRVGRLLRAYSLDELPQLWNVVRGEMSMVGPRPALPAEAERWTPELRQRVEVKPGITGMWQVSGRSDASFEDYVRLDLYYVDNWSFWTDLAIVVKTVPSVVLQRGAC